MPSQERDREASTAGFLTETGIPILSKCAGLTRLASLTIALGGSSFGAAMLASGDDAFWRGSAPLGGALPALCAAVVAGGAWVSARSGRLVRAGFLLFGALMLGTTLASWHLGAFGGGWHVLPFLALLASMCLGVVPGLTLAICAVGALAMPQFVDAPAVMETGRDAARTHGFVLMALTLASAIVGALSHSLLAAALRDARKHRQEQIETARALRQNEKMLRHAMRVDTVGDLAGLVSHQLRNAFQVMMGQVSLHAMDEDDKSGERLRLVGETLAQARPLLDQLMDLAHPEDGAVETCDLGPWVAKFVERVRAVMPQAIEVRSESSSTPLPVAIDPRGLEHAMWNLAINAKHAMEEGGVLTIVADAHEGAARIRVRDTGCGIPAEMQQSIFDPYFTTKPIGQGTGLGLTAVARFVLASHGVVELSSKVGEGAEFTLRFPIAAVRAQDGLVGSA